MESCLLCYALCIDTVGVNVASEDLPGLVRTDVASPVLWAGGNRRI